MKVLDVGCGNCKLKGAIGIDKSPGADIRHDLNRFPYPVKSNSFDKIYSRHCLEHLDYFEEVIEEFYRIVKKDGIIEIIVPFYASPGANHPTHKKFFNYHSFDILAESKHNRWSLDSKAEFRVIETKYHFHAKAVKTKYTLVSKIVLFLPEVFANAFPLFYQRFFGNILPAFELRFILKPIN